MKRLCSLWLAAALGACMDAPAVMDVDAGAPPGVDAGDVALVAEVYGSDRVLSPITPYVADTLRSIAARAPELRDDVFAKVGEDSTVSLSFLHCFDSSDVDLDDLEDRDGLAASVAWFGDGNAGGATPFGRVSRAAATGWSAGEVLSPEDGSAPLDQEYAAIQPRFAVILFGTHDIAAGNTDEYGARLLDIADRSIAAGVIPIFTAMMPRTDDAATGALVPAYNAVVRAVAQARQVPFIDLYGALLEEGVPGHGLGEDGVHLSVYRTDDGARPCVFTEAGLAHGHNVRNLMTLTTLHRLTRVLVHGDAPPDAPARSIAGTGTAEEPIVIAELPFTHGGDTSAWEQRAVDRYPGCMAEQDESGPELVYRMDVDQPRRVRAMVIDRGSTDVDVHLLQGGTGGERCVARGHRSITADVEAGTYYLAVDTFVSGGDEHAGEYLLVVLDADE